MLSINIEKILANSRLILTMTMITSIDSLLMSKFITSSTSSSNFICASSMPKKKKVLIVLGYVKFQFSIISIVSFCNYSLFFLNLKYMLDIKGI